MNHEADERTSLLPNGINNVDQRKDESSWRQWPAHTVHVTWITLRSNPVNVLLIFVPLGIVGGALHWSPVSVFILNFLAIIPLASLLAFATEQLSDKLGQTLGGLLNATFGNAVELIVSIVALKNGELRIVQSSMLGSMLSNMLLVLGCCFVAGGINPNAEEEQVFNMTAAQTMAGLLSVAAASLIIPATLYAVMAESKNILEVERRDSILVLSHGTAIILLVLYGFYLYFQLKSHKKIFSETSARNDEEEANNQEAGDEVEDEIKISPVSAGVILVIITVAVAICAEFLVDSIDSIVETINVTKTFIGLILLPIVGNAAEHVTAIVVSYKNKMDLAIGVAIGSSLQIALGVTPLLVVVGWAMNEPKTNLTLHFQTFETVIFFVSVLVVNYLINDGRSNYLEGIMLLGTYTIIALAFYIYPDNAGTNSSWAFTN